VVSLLNINFMTRKKAILYLAVLFFASFAIILLLAFFAKGRNETRNGFSRHFIAGTLKIEKQKILPFSISSMIGAEGNGLYFQTNSPYEIVKTNYNLDSFEIIKLFISQDKKLNAGFTLYLRGRFLYIATRHMPGVIAYDLASKVETRYLFNYYFNKEANISQDHFIFRRFDVKSKSESFIKIDLKNKDVQSEDNFSVNDGTHGFSTDGMLYYDQRTNLACYTFFYQNGFVCMDTNLNLTIKARTIDTLTRQKIKVAHVGSSFTLNHPPQFVNLMGCVSNGKLFLQSMLKADNEYKLDFTENTVIDIYNLLNGKYEGSFYIPKYKGKSPWQFKVIENNLFAMYGKTIVKHDLNFLNK
jgi:hypothetical protein